MSNQPVSPQQPEDPLRIAEAEIKRLNEFVNDAILPEAPAIDYFNLWTPGGMEHHITIRGWSIEDVIEKANKGIKYALALGWRTTERVVKAQNQPPANPPAQANQPAAPAAPGLQPPPMGAPAGPAAPATPPAASPASAKKSETVKIKSIAHKIGNDGQHYLNVKAGSFSKFGAPAYIELIQAVNPDLAQVFETWPVNQDFAPLAGFQTATIEYELDANQKASRPKVVAVS